MRILALALVFALALPVAGASVRTSWRADDAEALATRLLADPEWREAADARGAFAFEVVIVGGDRATYVYDGALRRASGSVDATIALSRSAALVVLNADEPVRDLRCLFDAGAVVVAPRTAPERVALRAYRAQLEAECAPPEGATIIAPGVFLLDGIAYDAFGSRLGWLDEDAPARLGRPAAGIARLAPEEIARPSEPFDRSDPWRAPLALASLLQDTMDCPCEARAPLIPAGDPRAALDADPRTAGGRR